MSHSNPRNPVVLIHGIFDTKNIFNKMSAYLSQRGWEVHCLNLIPNGGFLGIDRLAEQIVDYVDQTFNPNQPFDLVGFSMGGIVSRYYIQRLGGIHRVQRFITISSPHNGTWTSYLYITPGTLQMRPESNFLKALNQDIEQLNQLNFTSMWTPYDAMIIPAESSQVSVGQEVKVNVLLHSWMVRDDQCLKVIAETLSQPLKDGSIH